MTTLQKTRLTLPPAVIAEFTALGDTENETRDSLIVTLRELRWTLQSIADATELSRERVRQITASTADVSPVNREFREKLLQALPTPPERVEPTPREFIEPEDEALTELVALYPEARKVRSGRTEGRVEAEEFARLVWAQHADRGVPLYRLALRLDERLEAVQAVDERGKPLKMSNAALRSRLVRYGYKDVTGSSKAYTLVNEEARVR
jgi:transcriptional regulator with XRE-family HTH domain